MTIILNDVIYNTNTLFDKGFTHNYLGNMDNVECIEEPVILMNSLHSCYSHAIIDSCFSSYFIIQQLLEQKYISNNNIRIFILKEDFIYYPWTHNFVDKINKTYIGPYQNIINFITDMPIIFEHLTEKKLFFKQSFICPAFGSDKWQRSIWNCADNFPGRNIFKKDILYTDEYISKMLSNFRSHIFNKYNLSNDIDNNRELIIIERKQNKKINSFLLSILESEARKNIQWNYNGIVILEDMTFEEQTKLFNKTKIFILRHGSGLINLLWCKPGTTVFELEGGHEGTGNPVVTKRLCDLIGLNFIPLNYDNFNPICDIFNKIK